MPFKNEFDGVWLNVIKPTVEAQNAKCIRADNIFKVGSILKDILKSIEESDYIIADLSEKNPNVYYELGYAHALKKNVILLTQDIANLPFDIRDKRVIKYADTSSGAVELKKNLIKFIKNI